MRVYLVSALLLALSDAGCHRSSPPPPQANESPATAEVMDHTPPEPPDYSELEYSFRAISRLPLAALVPALERQGNAQAKN